jgi:hypothetical protein
MREEGHDDRLAPGPCRLFPELPEDLRVTGMYPIESSDGNDCFMEERKLIDMIIDTHVGLQS